MRCIRYVRKCPSFMMASRKSLRPSVEMGGGEGVVDVSSVGFSDGPSSVSRSETSLSEVGSR